MLVSSEWLNEFVPVADLSADELGDRLSRTGLEVDGISTLNDGLKKVVIGKTLEVVDHPDSDHLHICQVDVGEDEPLQIVCGAPNVAAGQKVIVALQNSWIAGHQKIKKGKMRGVTSYGMICALDEIGFSTAVLPREYVEGIMVLPDDAPIGMDIVEYLKMDDPIIDIDVTPNRGDALSMQGVAYDVGAIYERPVTIPTVPLDQYTTNGEKMAGLTVKVQNPDHVKEYNAVLVKDVKIAKSPLWMQLRLMKAGIRPINNVVDITNYIMMTTGHPLHAFDYDKLTTQTIETRDANDGETLVTLDGEKRELQAGDIVITDGERPIALAGVMGGEATEVDDATTNVLIEAAVFDGASVRKSERRLGLVSEAGIRNERGVNESNTLASGIEAAELMQQYAGGKVQEDVIHTTTLDTKPIEITTTRTYINQLLGLSLAMDEMLAIFDRLGFAVEVGVSDDELTVSVPRRRWDISIPADLAEEVARIYGYDKIPSSLPEMRPSDVGLTDAQRFERHSHQTMRSLGFDEVISYSLTSEDKLHVLDPNTDETMALSHPMSNDRQFMRTTLLGSLMDIAKYNRARQVMDVQIYELGSVYGVNDGTPYERQHLAALWTGQADRGDWSNPKGESVDFYRMKGVLETYFERLNMTGTIHFEATDQIKDMHPGQTAAIHFQTADNDTVIGFVGIIHPQLAEAYDLEKQTAVFELDLEPLVSVPEQAVVQAGIPKFPGSQQDIALIVDESVSHQDIIDIIREVSDSYLADVELFDIYRGEHIPDGKKSMAYTLKYLNPDGNLVDQEVSDDVQKIKQALEEKWHAELR
ncbi:MAG: phenylalanine--tRNA ligase subunit beta [Aerococcus sp.]|nr:phenylalanine--tRNA ligase subunit beta [Aerococcus sp.]